MGLLGWPVVTTSPYYYRRNVCIGVEKSENLLEDGFRYLFISYCSSCKHYIRVPRHELTVQRHDNERENRRHTLYRQRVSGKLNTQTL